MLGEAEIFAICFNKKVLKNMQRLLTHTAYKMFMKICFAGITVLLMYFIVKLSFFI